MSEFLDIFTKDGIKLGTMSKKEYYSQSGDVPWIKCCSCFVIDENNKKVLFEKRGNRFLDPGKLDLCSGHVQSNEPPRVAMVRELGEELGISQHIASNIYYLGNVAVDYTTLSDETNRKNLKCFVSMYALSVRNLDDIKIDNKEVVKYGWLSMEDAKGFIENSMTRMPYGESLKGSYDKIFDKLEKFISKQKDDATLNVIK